MEALFSFSRMRFKNIKVGILQNNVFLLSSENGGATVLIDAPRGLWSFLKEDVDSKKLNIVGVLLTHGHWDHVGDVHEFQKRGIPIYAHKGDAGLFDDPMIAKEYMPEMVLAPIKIDCFLEDGQILDLNGEKMQVLHTPGHTPGSLSYYFPGRSKVFVGDLLFYTSVGRTDFPGGDFGMLEKSIREKIYALPYETIIYPGHGPQTEVEHEKKHNQYVRFS